MTINNHLSGPQSTSDDAVRDAGVRYPHIKVQLTGRDGNAFAILGTVQRALKSANVPAEEIEKWRTEAMSGDYDNLLATCMRWVDVR